MSISSRSHRLSTSFSAIAEEKGQKLLDGYISKRGQGNKNYQRRWFVLYTNNILAYYLTKSGIYDKPQGEISLYTVTQIKEVNANEFQLITLKRTYELKCQLPDEQEEWLKIMKLRVSPNVPLQSWLYKKGEKGRGWKKRYCKLCEYELHYEVRYYEDEKCTKYKGLINCNYISNVKVLNDSSIKKYGKNQCLEIITDHRTYIVSAMDKKTRNLWYKQLKKVIDVDLQSNDDRDRWNQAKQIETAENAKLFDVVQQSMVNATTSPTASTSSSTAKQDPLSPLSPIHHLRGGSSPGGSASSGGSIDGQFPDIKSKSIFLENSPQNANGDLNGNPDGSPQGIPPDVHYERSPEPFMEKQSDDPLQSDVIKEHPKDPSTVNMENMVDILASTKIRGIDDDDDENADETKQHSNALPNNKSPFEIINGASSPTERSETNPFSSSTGSTGNRSSALTHSLVSSNGVMPSDSSRASHQRGGIGSTSYTMSAYTASSSTSSMDTPVPASMRNMPMDFGGDSVYSDIHSSTSKVVQGQQSIVLNKTGSVVHSQAFLKADYEDPQYGLMNDSESGRGKKVTNCQCLHGCAIL